MNGSVVGSECGSTVACQIEKATKKLEICSVFWTKCHGFNCLRVSKFKVTVIQRKVSDFAVQAMMLWIKLQALLIVLLGTNFVTAVALEPCHPTEEEEFRLLFSRHS